MGKKVFVNGMEISHKAGDGLVVAAFPDVCLSPPAPPAGPIPVPYPDTSKASDLQDGTTSVTVGGKPAALMGQSYFKSSPLGNEAATRTFGASVITHEITGKTYFQACSMNVTFEGKPVCRHLDVMTSNHLGAQPGRHTADARAGEHGSLGRGEETAVRRTRRKRRRSARAAASRSIRIKQDAETVSEEEWYRVDREDRGRAPRRRSKRSRDNTRRTLTGRGEKKEVFDAKDKRESAGWPRWRSAKRR